MKPSEHQAMMLIDTHCHLDDPSLSDRLEEVMLNSYRAGVGRFVVPGVHPAGWERIASLAEKIPEVSPAFGLHPQFADLYTDDLGARMAVLLRQGVGTGETGLDYSHVQIPRGLQIIAFREQVRLSVSLGLPLILHCRRAFQDLLTILREENVSQVGGVMHAFSGSAEVAEQCLRLGLYISIAGPVTYANAVKPLDVVRRVPLDRLLLETDAPDLTPEPYRGKINEPAYISETAKKVAMVKGVPLTEIAVHTTDNAKRLFRLH